MDANTGAPIAGADHIRQSIADILGTPLGTRLARRDYGSLLPELLDQPMNEVGRIRLFAATALALMRQEKRVRVSRVGLAADDAPGSWIVRVEGRRTDTPRAPSPRTEFSFAAPIRALTALA